MPGDKALRRDGRHINPEEDRRKLRLVHIIEVDKKNTFNLFYFFFFASEVVLTFPRLQENRVGHDIFNLHCQNVNPEQSRYISLSGEKRKKKDGFFLIKRADDGEAAARAQGERGTGA